ncbi:MAG: hypothetical protein MOB07_06455 [Acidobacteria bacterium]|nr:hypothetical protein [Acidobacteriota bacterium]
MKHRITKHLFCSLTAVAICLGLAGCSQRTDVAPAATSSSPSIAQNAAPAASASPATEQQAAEAGTKTDAAKPENPAASSTPQAPKPPRTFTLAAGRAISVYTASTLSTKSNKAGDGFTASLAQPIVDGDWVIAKKGAAVQGVIVNADPGGRVKGVASISVALKELTLADGRTVALGTSSISKQARTTKKKDATKIGIGAGAGALIGGIAGGGKGAAIGAGVGGGAGTGMVLATRGEPAVVPSESLLTFKLTAPIKITK